MLVVDDHADATDALARLVGMLDHTVRVRSDSAAGLEAVEVLKPDAVLLDLGLPGMDGYEIARHIRRAHPRGTLLLIAVSGFGQDEDRRRSRAAGFDHHLVKPADLQTPQTLLAGVSGDGA